MFRLIDSHCHLHAPSYDGDRLDILKRMEQENIGAITIGTNAVTSKQAIQLAESSNQIFATVGFHPSNLTSRHEDPEEPRDDTPYSIKRMRALAESSKRVVGIGEIGLDYYRFDINLDIEKGKEMQRRAFREQIALARDLDLPVIIHCRDAFDDLVRILEDDIRAYGKLRGVIHCFTGDWMLAQKLLDLGLFLSFTGIITFKPRAKDDPEQSTLRVIERMPIERIMIETDAPWLAPEPHRGKRNEPAYVEFVAETVARLRGISKEEAMRVTTENAMSFFRLS